MTTAAFIPVRLSSTRLPSKALLNLHGKPCIQLLIERVKRSKKLDLIVICTTTDSLDDKIIEIAKKLGIEYSRGSKKDILQRYLNAAIQFDVKYIVNVDGDDIFCDPALIDQTVKRLKESDVDFIMWRGLPFGSTPLGLKVNALKKICAIKDTKDTDTGWPKFFTETGLFQAVCMSSNDPNINDENIRLTLDYPEDLKLFEKIYENLKEPFSLKDIITLLHKKPELKKLNENLTKNWKQNFKRKSTKVKLKKYRLD